MINWVVDGDCTRVNRMLVFGCDKGISEFVSLFASTGRGTRENGQQQSNKNSATN